MRILADTNIVRPAVIALRAAGHDVVHIVERDVDPGDLAILAEALRDGRILISKDNDIGTHVFRDGADHAGVLLIDDLGSAAAETAMILALFSHRESELAGGAFVRAGRWGSRIVYSAD